MKRLIAILAVTSALSCAASQAQLETAERAAAAFKCKLEAVRPYFDDIDAARAFVQDVLARRIDPFAVLAELGVAAEEAQELGKKFKACSPSAEAPELGRELASR